MRKLRALALRFRGLFSHQQTNLEINDEIDSHLQMHIDDKLRAGMSPQQARRQAALKLGSVESAKEAYRERGTLPFFEHLSQDFRFTLRQLRKSRGFTCTAIFMLALGMCASVAIFAFVDATLLKPLPYAQPSRLVAVYETVAMFPQSNLSYYDYLDWKKQNRSFASFDAYQRNGFALSTATGPQVVRGARITDGFLRTLGVKPIIGRDFYAGEDLASAPRSTLISYATWQSRYGGKPDVLGKSVTLSGKPTVIVGVLPQSFHFALVGTAEYWTALHAENECDLRRSCHSLFGVARLNDGVSVQNALTEMKSIAKLLERQYPDSNRDQGAAVLPLTEALVGNIRPMLLTMLAGAVLLLLIATVNIAGLLLIRSESRRREIAVRHALGASAARLIGQFITEGMVLVAAGSMLGLLSAHWAMQLLTKLIPAAMLEGMPYLQGTGLNVRVLIFAGVIAVGAAALFSLTPALRLPLNKANEGLAEGSRGSAGMTWRRLGAKLVVLELATAMILLVGAGLLGKSLFRLLTVATGIKADRLATIDVGAPSATYSNNEQKVRLGRQIISRIVNLPGVQSAALSTMLPVSHNGNTTWFRVVGRPHHGEHNETPQREVDASYFETLGAKLIRGRSFAEHKDDSKPLVAIVNQAFVNKHFAHEDPIGKTITSLSSTPQVRQIVGVIDNIKEGQLDTATPPVLYFPFNQEPASDFAVTVRTSQDERSILDTLRSTIRTIDSDIVTSAGVTMVDRISNSPSAYFHRSSAYLVASFAAIAFLLSVIGLYGVVSYSVSQRTREIGVRMALGAHRSLVYRMILQEAGRLAITGIVIGLACSIAAATLMSGLLFGVKSWDLPTLSFVAILLGLAALAASYIPARRAASVNPVDALRAE